MRLGFIGPGHSGYPMAANLLAAGFELSVHDLDRTKASRLLDRGAIWAGSPGEAVRGADSVITSLPGPPEVKSAGDGSSRSGTDNLIAGEVADVAYLGADVHLFVRLESGRRVAVVEKNLGEAGQRSGDRVHLRFAPDDCIVVAAEPGDAAS